CVDPRALHSFPTRRSSDLSPASQICLVYLRKSSPDLRSEVVLGLLFRIFSFKPSSESCCVFDLSMCTTPVCFLRNYYKLFYKIRSEEHTSELQSRENLVCR